MKKNRFSESEICKILKVFESGMKAGELSWQYKVSQATLYAWRANYGGIDLPMIKKLKELENENRRLKRTYAEVSMDKEVLQELIEKKL